MTFLTTKTLRRALLAGFLSATAFPFSVGDAHANGEHVAPGATQPSFMQPFSGSNMLLLAGLLVLIVVVVVILLRIVRWASRA